MKTFLVIYFLALVLSINAKGTLDVYWVDVEGGAATLVVTPAGESGPSDGPDDAAPRAR